MTPLAYLQWDPSPYIFKAALPLLGRPLLWYGALFAMGFLAAYGMLRYLLRSDENSQVIADKLSMAVVIGGLVGARACDLLCYQGVQEVLKHPLSLLAIWEGGLASHGGAAGIIVALWRFSKRHPYSLLKSLDLIAIPVALCAVFIRVGNFMNQEILGTPTLLPWAVLFMHPADGGAIVPRHPAQLYEGGCYLIIFFTLLYCKRRYALDQKSGRLIGLFLILVFTARLLIEWVKVEQSVYIPPSHPLTMGQYLSVPWIALGAYLLLKAHRPQEPPAQSALSYPETHAQKEDKF